ncbi:MAG: hypothetical protein HY870_24290 [Chloroflexi bacterium]|nr:hypothetical protein [Chloroflexota bacterium]
MSDEVAVESPGTLPPYQQPDITHELELETRAGSPLGGDPLVDPLGLDPMQ